MLAIVLPQWLKLIDSVLKARSTVDTGGTLCQEQSTDTLSHLTEPGQIFNSKTSSFEHFFAHLSLLFLWKIFLDSKLTTAEAQKTRYCKQCEVQLLQVKYRSGHFC